MLHAEDTRLNIAVLDLESQALSGPEAATVTDELRSHLHKTDLFNIIERSRVNEILSEQGLQASDLCKTSECYAEMGQMMGVEKLIAGTIGRLGGLYVVSIRLIDVQSGKILIDITDKYEGTIEQVLTLQIPRVVRKLQDEILGRDLRVPFGTLSVQTNIPDAQVYINAAPAGRTPLDNVPSYGNNPTVRVEKKGFTPAERSVPFIKKGEHRTVFMELSPVQIQKRDILWRSAIVPGWGQLHNRQVRRAAAFGIAQAVCLGWYGLSLISYRNSADDYYDAHAAYTAALVKQDIDYYKDKRDSYYDTARQRKTLLYAAGGTAIAVWALNVADTYIFKSAPDGKQPAAAAAFSFGVRDRADGITGTWDVAW